MSELEWNLGLFMESILFSFCDAPKPGVSVDNP